MPGLVDELFRSWMCFDQQEFVENLIYIHQIGQIVPTEILLGKTFAVGSL